MQFFAIIFSRSVGPDSFMKGRHNPLILFVDTKSGLLTFCWLLGSDQYWLENAQLWCCMRTRNHATWSRQNWLSKSKGQQFLKMIWKLQRFGPLLTTHLVTVMMVLIGGSIFGYYSLAHEYFGQSWGDLGNLEVIWGNLWILLTRSWGRPRPTPALSFYSWAQRRYSGPLFVGAVSLSRGGEQLRLLGS